MLAIPTRPSLRRLVALAGVTVVAVVATSPAAFAANGASAGPAAWKSTWKDNPTQVAIGAPIAFLMDQDGVIFLPPIAVSRSQALHAPGHSTTG